MTNLIARYLLRRLRRVDPKVLAELKRELEMFNRKTKKWAVENYQPSVGAEPVNVPPRQL